jgi:hypothetical protein
LQVGIDVEMAIVVQDGDLFFDLARPDRLPSRSPA